MKILTTFVVVTALTLGGAASTAAQGRLATPVVGYVSMLRISTLSVEAKADAAKLEELRKERSAQIAAKQKDVEAAHLAVVSAGGSSACSNGAGSRPKKCASARNRSA